MHPKSRFKLLVITCLFIGLSVPFVLLFLSGRLFNQINGLNSALNENTVIQKNAQQILYHLVLAESAERAYCISGDRSLLSNYATSKADIIQTLGEEIQLLTRQGDISFAKNLTSQVTVKLNFISYIVGVYDQSGSAASQKIIAGGRGQALTNALIVLTNSITARMEQRNEALLEILNNLKQRDKLINYLVGFIAIAVFFIMVFFIFRNISTRDKYEKELLDAKEQLIENEKKFMHIFYNNPASNVYVDMESNVVMDVNESYLKLIGYQREEIINNPNFIKLIKVSEEDVYKLRHELRTKGFCNNLELQLTVKSGEVRTIILFATVVRGIDSRLGVIHNITDVTESRRAASEIIKARHDAEAASGAKDEFLANMSHEIRTPLNAILGFTNLLNKTQLSEKQDTYLKALKVSSASLLHITNDILDYSKLESGMFKIEHISFDLQALVNSVYTMFTEKAREKKLKYLLQTDAQLPAMVLGDPTRLTQILINLLGNAFKFTSEGTITLAVNALEITAQQATVAFTISDSGIGIDEADLEIIFERFNQTAAKITRQYGGTGLGLAIVKRLVELQDGTITVNSERDRGSQFSVSLSYELARAETAVIKHENTGASALTGLAHKKILLAEDNHLNQVLARELLQLYGIELTVAANGQEAIDILHVQEFDLVLMDLQMPLMDGYKTTEYIRHTLHLGIPVIAMSAHVQVAEKEKCLKAGMNDFISKPFKEEDLKWMLKKHLLAGEQAETKKENKPGIEKQQIVDLSEVLKISRGNNEFIKKMIQLFLTETPDDLARLKHMIQLKDYKEIEETAHKLKSSVGIIGLHHKGKSILETMEAMAHRREGIEWMPASLAEFEAYLNEASAYLSEYLTGPLA